MNVEEGNEGDEGRPEGKDEEDAVEGGGEDEYDHRPEDGRDGVGDTETEGFGEDPQE